MLGTQATWPAVGIPHKADLSHDLVGLFNPASYFEKLNEIGAGEMTQQLKALTILYLIRPEFGFPAPTLKAKDYL